MTAVDFACLWFGRFWGCFWICAVLFVVWLVVRDRLEDRRERLAETVRSHPAALSDDWRHDVRRATELQCGPDCWTPDAPHAEPRIYWIGDDPLAHGEDEERTVPGTGGWNGLYTAMPDNYCLCGHPNYMTCPRWITEGIASMTFGEPGEDAA